MKTTSLPRHEAGAYKELTLQQLRSFCETARLGSFMAAAHSLGLAHPTIWQQVHTLERQLGTRLVEPHKRGCRLTEEGRVLAEMAGSVVTGIDSLKRRFQEILEHVRPQLTVGTTQRILMEDLCGVIPVFEQSFPSAQLCFREQNVDQVIAAVEAGEADLGITTCPEPTPASPWLLFEPAYELDVVLLTPRDHPLARRRQIRPKDLLDFPTVNIPGGFRDPAINAQLEKLGFFQARPRKVEVSLVATVRHFVALGYGIGLVVGLVGRGMNPGLHERSMSRYFGRVRSNLIWRRGTQGQGVAQAFVEAIRSQLPAPSQ
jgi:DNA-binding transcriptional LysR family regulator